ncbi:MAG: glycoside hydrolase family 3 C-terminal domain-containing protein [Flavobacteriales bacterium]|nr:glycoside hydrolase family 3 C-terminal domain-containing protein [Flavobacteriales bacterium]
MKIIGYIALFFALLLTSCNPKNGSDSADRDPSMQFADSLLSQLSLEEKVGQMTNLSLMALAEGEFWDRRDTVILDPEKMKLYLDSFKVGSIQNLGTYPFSPAEWRQNIGLIQDYVAENTRHKIPVLYGIDAVHGANYSAGSTLFPHQIGIAASRSRKVASEIGRITSYEMRASGIHWNYAPVLDVTKEPLWGRTFETFGEDTYIASELGLAMIKGGGSDSLLSPYSGLACLKHFIGYGAPHNGKDRAAVYLPQRIVLQDYLPPFQKAIENGALTIMVSSNSLNGVASHADKSMLTDLLKKELGFKGFVISDWNDIDNLVKTHQVAKDEREAVKISVNAGLDMCMEPYDASFAEHLLDLVDDGEVSINRINDAVRRILYVKHKMGLFDQIQSDPIIYPLYGSDEFAEIAKQMAIESITLLKNENESLPLRRSETILLTGAGSNSINSLNGAWSRTWSGQDTTFNDKQKLTLKGALEAKVGKDKVRWTQGSDYDVAVNIKKAVQMAAGVDRVVIALSELPSTEKPSDIDELDFPECQIELVKQLSKTGKPITLILLEGRPRLIEEIEPLVESIVLAYLPGNEGGLAIAEILYGDANPSGKLPFTYPKYSGAIWSYDHAKADARDKGFGFEAYDPQYKFGHGLSYTNFSYSNLILNGDSFTYTDTVQVSVMVKNTGAVKGKEVVELYVSDLFASIVPKNRSLKGFKKIEIEPNDSTEVNFYLAKNDFEFVNSELENIVESGEFKLAIDTHKIKLYFHP